MGTTKMVSGHMLITKTTWLFFIHYRHLLGVNHGFTLRLTVGDLYSFLPSKYFRQKRDIYGKPNQHARANVRNQVTGAIPYSFR